MFGCSEFWVIWSCFHHSWSKTDEAHRKHLVWTPWLMFGDPVLVILLLKKLSDEEGKWKHISPVFKTHHPWLSGNLVNKLSQWAPSPMHCPIHLRLVMIVGASPVTLHFSENFLLKIFPFLTSFSQPLLIFTSFLIPNELAPWHHSPYSKTKPGLRRSSVFEEQCVIEALN